MTETAHHKTCPRCGGILHPNIAGPETPPWRCDECHKSYWVAQLTQEARQHFRHAQHDYGWLGSPGHTLVHEAIEVEMREAAARGVSLRREQIGLIGKAELKALMERHKGQIGSGFLRYLRQAAK
jgi:DNA-directed RNA polymerase subunit M/transcription elongation factor TFIIS